MRLNPAPTSDVAVAVGDFDGDGHPEVAVAYDYIFGKHRRLNIYEVDPGKLAPQLKYSAALTGDVFGNGGRLQNSLPSNCLNVGFGGTIWTASIWQQAVPTIYGTAISM